MGKESSWQCRRYEFDLWVEKISCRRKWQPTPIFLKGESHGQRSLAAYTVQGVLKNLTGLSNWTELNCAVLSHSVVSDFVTPMDCSLPGSSAHGILQARILEWVAIPFSRGSSQSREGSNPGLLHRRQILHYLSHSGYRYMYSWFPSLFTWNYHNIANQLYTNTK